MGDRGLKVGAWVCLVGLCATPRLNSRSGRLLHWDRDAGRWAVRMDVDGSGKKLKENNLVAIAQRSSSVFGVAESMAELVEEMRCESGFPCILESEKVAGKIMHGFISESQAND